MKISDETLKLLKRLFCILRMYHEDEPFDRNQMICLDCGRKRNAELD